MSQIASGRIPTLDGLRAISIALVFAAHAFGTRNLPMIKRAEIFGNLGVRTFFIISGFLITTLLLRELGTRGTISLRKFYIRRVFRIFPAFYAYLAVLAIVAAFGAIELPVDDVAYAATYTMNFHAERAWWLGHLWSLSVEEQFYLIWPVALVFAARRRAAGVAVAAIAAAPILRSLAFLYWPSVRPLTDQAFPFVFDALATGCLLALVRSQLERSPRYRAFIDSPFVWLAVAAGIAALAVPRAGFNLLAGITLGNFAIAIAIHHCVLHADSPVGRVLESRPFVFVGALSYSLYLWQQPFINRHADHLWSAFPVNIVCAFVAALASYCLVETPILRYRERARLG